MKKTFTLITVLILVATSMFAQERPLKRSKQTAGGFPKYSFESPGGKSVRNPLPGATNLKSQKRSLKSAEAVKQRLDSYSAQAYDATSGQWIPDYKADIFYDGSFNVLKISYYAWDSSTSQWAPDGTEENSYNAGGILIQSLYTGVDEITNQIVIYEKHVYSYDAQGNMIQDINYESDQANQLVATWKGEFTYDANGNRTQSITYALDEVDQMAPVYKNDFTYNSSGNEINEVYSYWIENTWNKVSKYESTYNSNGNIILYTSSDWDFFNNKWSDPSGKYEYSYNANGKLTQESQFNRNSNNTGWDPRSKDDYLYDANGNNTQHINYYNWDTQTDKWNEVWKEEYTFNNNYSFNDLILPFDEDVEIFTHMLTEINEYSLNISTLEWTLDYKTNLVYSEQNFTSVNRYGKDVIKVYPNPFTESVTINVPAGSSKITFDLYDQQGRKLMTRLISNDKKVSLKGLNKGMYVYTLNIEGKIQSGKMVKE